ncbi:MAG: biopolymer transporter ExbD [Cyanobacteria bacterium QH_8_48_120]|jgi:biopolymer transport protein ExbD|nr:MAG: biopolymer transporter ExbD [Cyanobacteria bacterium QH_1_48_107]PSO59335.1 MAG: biopolymer transporter ExbD [Cyanobacteria bacterium QH_10_48_56]PSO66568.1 MAG: biopolymer transporter ExbD [Cyanobacteria bacterium QH_6_48_35]PSO67828.1 MAG: biopolymer transporter ExbD [Cyanobacteria bacterium QH_7_48_89]PSO73313.1 MAG: biopolymer transporter ExbD [Cyanobacteria bacterium QH_8_48_120]PSO74048.1 MAG: biopolymer transporter ExbD [Cyanobacteria bacterium QS_1_48_34]PSO74408.1 MAG: biopol
MRLPDESDTSFGINIVPMIDVIFSILAFFIISTLYLTHSQGLPVNLPQAATAQNQRAAQVNVTIKSGGEIALNKKPIKLEALEAKVRPLIEPNSGTLVIVNADEKVKHGQVVGVMDRLRQVEGAKLAIAAEKE